MRSADIKTKERKTSECIFDRSAHIVISPLAMELVLVLVLWMSLFTSLSFPFPIVIRVTLILA